MNDKYTNIYTVSLGLAALFLTLLLSQKFTLSELFIVFLSFVFILLAFNLKSNNQFNSFLKSSKRIYIAVCLLIPCAILLKMKISEDIPRHLDILVSSSKSTEIKIDEFTNNGEYQNLFKKELDNYIIKSQKKENIPTIQVFSFQDVCVDIKKKYSEITFLITVNLLTFLGLCYFALIIGVKIANAVTENKNDESIISN